MEFTHFLLYALANVVSRHHISSGTPQEVFLFLWNNKVELFTVTALLHSINLRKPNQYQTPINPSYSNIPKMIYRNSYCISKRLIKYWNSFAIHPNFYMTRLLYKQDITWLTTKFYIPWCGIKREEVK